jgi:uncharacterized protein
MQILVDADACSVVKEIIKISRINNLCVSLVSNYCHEHIPRKDVKIIKVENKAEAADIALMNISQAGDIAVTGDIGLACMLLGKEVRVISSRGKIFSNKNIDRLMEFRHVVHKKRRLGKLKKGGGRHKAFSSNDRERFIKNFSKLIISPGDVKDEQGD